MDLPEIRLSAFEWLWVILNIFVFSVLMEIVNLLLGPTYTYFNFLNIYFILTLTVYFIVTILISVFHEDKLYMGCGILSFTSAIVFAIIAYLIGNFTASAVAVQTAVFGFFIAFASSLGVYALLAELMDTDAAEEGGA